MNEYRPRTMAPGEELGMEFVYPGADNDGENQTELLWHYLRVLRRQAWKIAGFVFAVVAGALL